MCGTRDTRGKVRLFFRSTSSLRSPEEREQKKKKKKKKQCLFYRLEPHRLITFSNFSEASSSLVCSSFNDFYVLAEFLHGQH